MSYITTELKEFLLEQGVKPGFLGNFIPRLTHSIEQVDVIEVKELLSELSSELKYLLNKKTRGWSNEWNIDSIHQIQNLLRSAPVVDDISVKIVKIQELFEQYMVFLKESNSHKN